MEKPEQVTIDKIDIIPISLNTLVSLPCPLNTSISAKRTSNPHFLICAIYSDETLSPVCSSTYAFIYSYVAFPLNSDKSISSREKSTFTFLLSAILRSTSVRADQRSTGPLAPLESKTTVSTCRVKGNISYGEHSFIRYPCLVRYFRSLASVSGPQDT